jgi:uncharacterized membrane protein (DUF2068 family)
MRERGHTFTLNGLMITVIVALLAVVDFLTFHDLFEPHTIRDWLTLVVSVIVVVYVVRTAMERSRIGGA